MREERLLERLRKVEALWAGATTPGEARAAAAARQRLLDRLRHTFRHAGRETGPREPPPVEYRFSMPDRWARVLFEAVLRRHGLEPYRYRRQRRSTIMVRASTRLLDETVLPEFRGLWARLERDLERAAERVLADVF